MPLLDWFSLFNEDWYEQECKNKTAKKNSNKTASLNHWFGFVSFSVLCNIKDWG